MIISVNCRDGVGLLGQEGGIRVGGHFHFKQIRDGKVIDEWDAWNKVPNVGLDHILATEFTAGAQITSWYVGLTNASPTPAAADTMASHSGWTENVSYSEANRPAYTGVESTQAVTNSASPATFTINAGSQTIGGAFVTSGNGKSGTTGTLACVAAFSGGNRTPASGDQIVVTYTYSAASVN